MKSAENHFSTLTPETIMEALVSIGLNPTGTLLQLNSYENRVYEIHLEEQSLCWNLDDELLLSATNSLQSNRLIVKFYRPERWTQNAILEEHHFLAELGHGGIPAIQALNIKEPSKNDLSFHQAQPTHFSKDGQSLFSFGNHLFALFPKCFGRQAQELQADDYRRVGGLIARIHNLGQRSHFHFRPTHEPQSFGFDNLDFLDDWIAPEVKNRYREAAEHCLDYLLEYLNPNEFIRIHGDCHQGNLLVRDVRGEEKSFFIVDFDDSMNGHPAQDLWMLASTAENEEFADELLDGYNELRQFRDSWMDLFEPLRALRIVSYGAWIARRWKDPSFPRLFPHFRDYNYWAEETDILEHIARNV